MMTFITWLGTSPASAWIRDQSPWLWPLCETLHFMGLALLIGFVVVFDLRLLGMLKQIPLGALRGGMVWAFTAVGINLVTGLIFFTANPYQYYVNPVWWAKVSFLLISGLNALYFETTLSTRALALGPDEETPRSCKIVGGLSLVSWSAVLVCGRMLAFVGGTD
jgi:hypothetical protein